MNQVEKSMVFGEAGHVRIDGKRVSLERIEEAARCIDPVFLGSPQYEAEALGDELGQQRPEYQRIPPLPASALALESRNSSTPALLLQLARDA